MFRSIALLVAMSALAACGAGDGARPGDGDDAPAAATGPASTTPALTTPAPTTPAPSAPAPSAPAPTRVVVSIESSRYSMPELELRVGDTIRFEQLDPYAHTVTQVDGTGDAPTFDSGELQQGESFEITFDRAGTYEYFCRIHPTMRGTVVVS